eukprot:5492517-Pleurochrysis_carterae.AAC.1
MSVGRDEGRLRCPGGKRDLLLAAMAELQDELAGNTPVPWRQARSVVGKLANLAQALPELKLVLRGGYAVSRPASAEAAGGGRQLDEWLHLKKGGRATREWQLMLDVATDLVTANEGVPLAPQHTFAGIEDEGCVVVTTDASGKDGVGGYGFRREPGDDTDTAWLVSEAWPTDAREALRRGAATAAERVQERRRVGSETLPVLSMPAAELFGSWAVAEAINAESRTASAVAVIAVGDCDPAAAALNSASSGAAAMRELLRGARLLVSQWLAVSVPRKANGDADRLSHPHLAGAVSADAEAAGWRVARARIPQ